MKPDNEKDETQHEEELAGSEGAVENKLTEPDEELSENSAAADEVESGTDDDAAEGPKVDEPPATIEPEPDTIEPESDTADEQGADEAEPGNDKAVEDEEAAADDKSDDDDAVEAAVVYENGRPLVQELEYQAPRGKAAATANEDGESADVKFSSVSEAKAVIEGFLFSCNEPLSVNKLSKLMSNLHPKTVRGLLLELQWEYENRPGGLQVVEIAGGYQMSTRAFVAPWMFRMHKHKRRSALSPATLETLAIIAYRQPITKGEIEAIRGVESGAPLRTLQELNLVEASGRREVIGRPQLYVTTDVFLKTFGLKSVGDLPSISELKAKYAEEQKLKPVTAAAPAKAEEESAEKDDEPTGEEPAETKDGEAIDIEGAEDDVALEGGADEPEETEIESDEGDSEEAEDLETAEEEVDPVEDDVEADEDEFDDVGDNDDLDEIADEVALEEDVAGDDDEKDSDRG